MEGHVPQGVGETGKEELELELELEMELELELVMEIVNMRAWRWFCVLDILTPSS